MDSPSSPPYVDTPYGIMTAGGQWYHVTEQDVRKYAGEVLDHVSLEQLLDWADHWMDSARTVFLWFLPGLLWALPIGWAVGGGLGLYILWALASPALPSLMAVKVISWLDHVLVQGLFYVLTMSALAAMGMDAAVGVGLLTFILLRWGVVGWAFGYIIRPLRKALYPLPVADQILRGLIIRVALKYRLSVPQVSEITKDILENWSSHKDDD